MSTYHLMKIERHNFAHVVATTTSSGLSVSITIQAQVFTLLYIRYPAASLLHPLPCGLAPPPPTLPWLVIRLGWLFLPAGIWLLVCTAPSPSTHTDSELRSGGWVQGLQCAPLLPHNRAFALAGISTTVLVGGWLGVISRYLKYPHTLSRYTSFKRLSMRKLKINCSLKYFAMAQTKIAANTLWISTQNNGCQNQSIC